MAIGSVLGLAVSAFFGAHTSILADAESPATVQSVPAPSGANSAEPQVSNGEHTILSWLELEDRHGVQHATLKFAERTPSGWTKPKIAAAGDDFFVNSLDVPSIHQLADGTIVAQWLQRNSTDPDSDAYNVRLSLSKDRGITWSRPTSPHHDSTKTQHGFVSLFASANKGFGLVWLDGRATNPETEEGDMALRAAAYDASGKQVSETVVASRVCDCCETSAAETSDGTIIAFRSRSADEVRDIYVTRLADGHWSAPIAVHNDGWRINACPMNGPSISARGRDVAVAWFTAKDNQGRAFVAFSHDAGKTFGPAIRVDDASSRGRLGVQMLENGSAAVMWVESANRHSSLRMRTVSAAGVRSSPVLVADKAITGVPRLAYDQGELLFSWTESTNDSPRIHTARANIGMK